MNDYELLKNIISQFKDKKISKQYIIGSLVLLILNKKIFKKNEDVSSFLENILDIKVPTYLTRSRTMMVAKVCRLMNDYSNSEIESYRKKILPFIIPIYDQYLNFDFTDSKNIKSPTNLDAWISGILKNREDD